MKQRNADRVFGADRKSFEKEMLKRMRENPEASPSVGWYCGNCKNWHGPQVSTCPQSPNRSLKDRIVSVDNG